MENKLRLLIRKTLIENYTNSGILNEGHQTVATLSAKLSPEAIAKVEAQFNEINSNINAAAKYAWNPTSSKDQKKEGQSKTKNEEHNLLVEMIHERMSIEDQKRALMLIYSQDNKALQAWSSYYVSRDLGNVNRATLDDAFRDGWTRIFIGTPQKSDPTKEYKKFDDYAAEYATNVKGAPTSTFAGTIVGAIQTATRESYSELVNTKMTSLDAPSRITGKGMDAESGDDFGSDTLHADNPEDVLSGAVSDLDGGFEGGDEGEVNLDTDITSDDYVEPGSEEDATSTLGGTIGDELEDSEAQEMAQKRAKTMSKILILSIEEAIDDFKKFGKPSDTQLMGLNLINNVINTGQAIDPKDLRFVNDLKKNKRFLNTINRYMYENGFRNSRNKPVSFEDIKMKYVTDAVNYLKTKDTAHVPAEKGLSSDYVSDETASEKSKEIFGDVDLKDIRNKVISLKKNLKNIVTQNPSEENLEGVQALSGIFSGLDLRQVSSKLGKPVSDINKAVLSLQQGTNAQEVVDLVRALKTGKYKPGYEVPYDAEAEQSLAEAVEIADSILMEIFMKKNLDKIMERVYHRLSKNL